MKVFAASKAKANFGELIDTAQREPVTITKKDRPVAVLLSQEEFLRFQALEDALWADRAAKIGASKKPMSHEEGMKALEGFLSA